MQETQLLAIVIHSHEALGVVTWVREYATACPIQPTSSVHDRSAVGPTTPCWFVATRRDQDPQVALWPRDEHDCPDQEAGSRPGTNQRMNARSRTAGCGAPCLVQRSSVGVQVLVSQSSHFGPQPLDDA